MQSRESLIIWLNRYRENEAALDDILERIAALRSRLTSPKGAAISGMPHGSGSEGDPFARSLAHIEVLENQAQDLLKVSRLLYRELNDTINQITGKGWPDQRCVLRCRYIDRFSWNEVNEILFSRRSDFEERQDTFLRRTFKIHNEALKALQEIVPESEVQEIK